MACENPDIRVVKCGDQTGGGESVSTPFGKIGAVFGVAGTIIGVITTIVTVSEKLLAVVAALGGAAASGALAGAATAILLIVVIGLYALDRCVEGRGVSECIAGAINEIITDFNSATDELFPFTAMHTRVDVIVKSRFWNKVESNNAFVHCTDDAAEHRSELFRCYYFTDRVCNAAHGAQVGAAVGAVAAVIAAAAIAAAIGCATVILCIFALLLAIIVAAIAVLVGALIGGQIAKATTDDTAPTSGSGSVLTVGDLVTVKGNLERRDEDQKANLFWFAHETDLLGHVPAGIRQPLSYCEINDLIADGMDGCFFVIR
jgi:hypothetical protein